MTTECKEARAELQRLHTLEQRGIEISELTWLRALERLAICCPETDG